MDTCTVNGAVYVLVKLLGKGKGGYSWLAERNGQHYVLKQIHHEPCSYYTFGNKIESERRDYELLQRAGIRTPRMLDIDLDNERIIKEYIDGPTADQLILADRLPASCLTQLRHMADLAHAAGLNIDYYPTNFVLQGDTLYYIDYECNPYCEEWNLDHWGLQYWSRTEAFRQAFE